MATSDRNVVTHGMSGKVGDIIIFKQQNGKTVVSKIPKKRVKPLTQKQLNVHQRFTMASKYAKQVMEDPVMRAKYISFAKDGKTAFNVAFADFFKPPVLSDPWGTYNGEIGCTLKVKAIDNYEVKEVKLAIYAADDSLVEEGEATIGLDGVTFSYTCNTANAQFATASLVWSASDLANNLTELELAP